MSGLFLRDRARIDRPGGWGDGSWEQIRCSSPIPRSQMTWL